MGSIGKPITLGKIEDGIVHRIWKDQDSKNMNNSLNTIITKDIHMSLNYMTPKQVYKRSVRHVVG